MSGARGETFERECQEREDAFLKEQEQVRARKKAEQSKPLNMSRDFRRGASRDGDERSR
jgi:hypothetical protein